MISNIFLCRFEAKRKISLVPKQMENYIQNQMNDNNSYYFSYYHNNNNLKAGDNTTETLLRLNLRHS